MALIRSRKIPTHNQNRSSLCMVFPFSISGHLRLEGANSLDMERIMHRIAARLQKKHASDFESDASSLSFRVRPFAALSSFSLLAPISSGRVTFHPDGSDVRISYHISCVRFVVMMTSIMTLFLAWPYFRANFFPPELKLVVPLIWLWIVGGNWILSLIRFRRFLRKCCAK